MSNLTQTFRGTVSPDLSGVEFDKKSITVTTPGSEQTLISYTVPAGNQVNLLQVIVTCRFEGVYRVQVDSDIIGSGRIGPGNLNATFTWLPFKQIDAGKVFAVKFQQISGRPSVAIEAYAQGRELTL